MAMAKLWEPIFGMFRTLLQDGSSTFMQKRREMADNSHENDPS